MKSPSSSCVAPSRVVMPMTPLPPRRCARNALTAVRLMKPPCVMLMMHSFIGDEILHVDLAFVGDQLGQARAGVFLLNLAQLLLDDLENTRFFREDVAQILDRLDQLLVFADDLLALEPGQLVEAQLENLIRLMFAESVATFCEARFVANQDADLLDLAASEFEGEQFDARFIAIRRAANDADEFIEIRERDEVTFERLGALFGFAQFEAGSAQDDFAPMLDVRPGSLP